MFRKPYLFAAVIVCTFLWFLMVNLLIEVINKG